MRDNRRILVGSWLLALFAVAFVACSSPATAPGETESAASAPVSTSPPGTIPSAQAAQYIGIKGRVCGLVVDTRPDISQTVSISRGVSLDFDQPFPNSTFQVIIHPSDERNFEVDPRDFYKGKEVCATGDIHSNVGDAHIRVDEPSDLEVMP